MDLLSKVKSTLKKDQRLTSADGELLKSKIIELTLKLDEELVALLLDVKELKDHFSQWSMKRLFLIKINS